LREFRTFRDRGGRNTICILTDDNDEIAKVDQKDERAALCQHALGIGRHQRLQAQASSGKISGSK